MSIITRHKKLVTVGVIVLVPLIGFLGYAGFLALTERVVVLETDPVDTLPPHAHVNNDTRNDSLSAPGHGVTVTSEDYIVPEDMWLVKEERIVTNAPPSVLHHLLLYNKSQPSPECPNDYYQEIGTLGNDTPGTIVAYFPSPYGVFLKKGTVLFLRGMLHNPLPPEGPGGTYHDVSMGLKLTFEKFNRTKPMYFNRIWLDDLPHCEPYIPDSPSMPESFAVPAGTSTYMKSSDDKAGDNPTRLRFSSTGFVGMIGAHLHEFSGGRKLELFLNGKSLHTFIPIKIPTENGGYIMPPWRADLRVQKGDEFTLRATYGNNSTAPVTDAMGQIGVFFAPDN